MNWGTETAQQRVVDIEKGIYCIQYKDAEDQASPPKVVVGPVSGYEGQVELLLHPDAHDSTLWGPGSSLVLRVSAAAKIHVEVFPLRPNGSRAASVRIEPLSQGTPRSTASVGWDFNTPSANLEGLRVLAHVAGIGDVFVNANEWIAGPAAPSRIEGIAIQWANKPRTLDVRYAVRTAAQTGVVRMVDLDAFAGTRGRALAITGFVVELSGPGAGDAQIVAEAVFLSAPVLRMVGQRVVLAGPTGREPLVGLRLAIQGIGSSASGAGVPAAPINGAVPAVAPATPVEMSTKGKVRVFRRRPKPNQVASE